MLNITACSPGCGSRDRKPGRSASPHRSNPVTCVLLDLLHELEADTARRIDERDAAFSEWAFDDRGTPHDRVAFELRVEVVGEQCGMEEPFGGQVDGVLVDGASEQR